MPMKSVELTEWATDNSTRHDVALIGAFVYAMKQQRLYAAPADFYDAAFNEFKDEVA